jgi:hypothetical protein
MVDVLFSLAPVEFSKNTVFSFERKVPAPDLSTDPTASAPGFSNSSLTKVNYPIISPLIHIWPRKPNLMRKITFERPKIYC